MSIKKNAVNFFILLLSITACSKSGDPSKNSTIETAPVKLPDADIYMAGNTNGPNNYLTNATYWKNGIATILSDGSPDSRSTATAIALKDNDVYIGGVEYIGGTKVACYWKNGVYTKLSDGRDSYVSAVIVNGNNVYMAGTTNDKDGFQQVTYWKNGVATVYPKNPAITSFTVTGIAVNGDDVYLSGGTTNKNDYGNGVLLHSPLIATYWKNGIIIQLESEDGYLSIANGITVNGTDVYAVGNYKGNAIIWKNNAVTELTKNDDEPSEARAVATIGSDVYVSGYISGQPAYWKNNIATKLKNGLGYFPDGLANAIVVNNTGLYVASGYDGTTDYSTFWFNGQSINACKGIGIVNGIVVVPR